MVRHRQDCSADNSKVNTFRGQYQESAIYESKVYNVYQDYYYFSLKAKLFKTLKQRELSNHIITPTAPNERVSARYDERTSRSADH